MNVIDAIKSRRTIRKFTGEPVTQAQLRQLIECGRVSATGANMQPLKFAAVLNEDIKKGIFANVKWAGYLPDGAPKSGHEPAAYIVILQDTSIKKGSCEVDAGSAISAMMLEAVEMGLGTCWMGAINRPQIKKLMALPEHLEVMYVLSVGYPAQKSTMYDSSSEVKYYEDENGEIHVPKRPIDDITLNF